MKSSNQQQFSQAPSVKASRSRFNRSHGHKTTFDAGWLVPVYLDEVLPGDSISLKMTHFGRLATPLKPVMDNMYIDTHFFFVPNRLVWDNWEKMQGAQDDPGDSIDYIIPIIAAPASTGYAVGSLADYMGLPVGIPNFEHSALPFRAYNLIYNQWYRPQDIIDSVVVDKDDADGDPTDYVLLRRAKRHDYFTSVLPQPQKGDDVLLPLGTEAPVLGIGKYNTVYPNSNTLVYETGAGAQQTYPTASSIGSADNNLFYVEQYGTAGTPWIRADLTAASAATINSLREAFQLQRLLERDARSGTRYVEVLNAHFGVTSPDFRLQRAEYLGGGSQRLNTTPIPQNSVAGATPQGNLAGMGVVSGQVGFSKSFVEHGYIIGIASLRADLNYQQGLHKLWTRSTRYDFYMPVLANLGEQAVLTKELYCQNPTTDTGTTGTPDNEKIFGYQERWAEYRYKPSQITGLFRSQVAGTLEVWHLAQEFSALPTLDQTFIEENPPIDRVIATPSEPHLIFDSYFEQAHIRPMPVYSVPGLIDHL